MRAALSAILWCTLIPALAQTGIISGKVTDNKKEPLPFASVYINQTTIGTTTGVDGTFKLQRVPEGEQDLVVSFVGFQTFQTTVTVDDSVEVQVVVNLLPSTTAMKEVQIRSKKDKDWEIRYEKFHRLFFGTQGAAQCRILNPWVLEFEDGTGGRLLANASEAMEIENLSLGYRLFYLLKKFEVGSTDFNIVGLVRFHELEAGDKELKDLWTSRRLQAYLGSTRHFLKSVVENRDMQEGFQLFIDLTRNPDVVRNQVFSLNVNESIYPYTMIGKVLPGFSDGRFTARFPSRLEVHYRRKVATPAVYSNVSWPVSWLEVDGGSLYINKQGVPLNSSRLTTLGAMSEARVAEILPYDYEPRRGEKEESVHKRDSVAIAAVPALNPLLEKPYLQIDKPYYYHNDMVFFKAYMNYARPVTKDTLSRVLYVDLVSADGKVVASRTLPIVNGMSSGDFFIGPGFPEGDFQIRAYTRWMLNFGTDIVFKKPVKVIADNQLGRSRTATTGITKGVNLILEKSEYAKREKVTMLIEAIDALDFPVAANLSVAVTNAEQAVPPQSELTILNSYPFSERDARSSEARYERHHIQYGIPFSGKLIAKKKSQKSGEVRLVQNNSDVPLTLLTDTEGKFSHELQLMDSMVLYMEAVTARGKPTRAVIDSTHMPRPEFSPLSPLDMEFYVPADPSKVHMQDALANARILSAVTISETRIAPRQEKPFNVDVVVDNAWLRATMAIDLLSALQRRVPGLRIVYKTSPGGNPVKYMVFSGNFSFDGSAQEPLVILDGVPVEPDEGSMAEKLAQITTAEVENVEVLKTGNAAMYGARGANGVIMVTTTRGRSEPVAARERDISTMQVVKLPGYSAVTAFEGPDYSVRQNEDTDVRSTLYWNPNVNTTGKEPIPITFYTADLPGPYRIVVEGLTMDGSPVRAERFIQVKGD